MSTDPRPPPKPEARKSISWSTEPKKRDFFVGKSRALSKHTETFCKFHVFPSFMRGVSETPSLLCFLDFTKRHRQKMHCSENLLTTWDRKTNSVFERVAAVFGGPETPIFVVFSRPQKGRVQLSSLEATKIGFNYAPVSAYIYIYMCVCVLWG